jgi:hypothetical protein
LEVHPLLFEPHGIIDTIGRDAVKINAFSAGSAVGSSFWMPAARACAAGPTGSPPGPFCYSPNGPSSFQTAIEGVVATLLGHHLGRNQWVSLDPTQTGAEWWVQHRRAGTTDEDSASVQREESLPWHWDNDDTAWQAADGVMIHPRLATVTYLGEVGAPTCVFDQRCSADGVALKPATALSSPSATPPQFYISHPRRGKHISFDGQLLHCVPRELSASSCKGERLTLLVNIWVDHRPDGCVTLADALSQSQMEQLAANIKPIARFDSQPSATQRRLVPADDKRAMDEISHRYADRVSFGRVPVALTGDECAGIVCGPLQDLHVSLHQPSHKAPFVAEDETRATQLTGGSEGARAVKSGSHGSYAVVTRHRQRTKLSESKTVTKHTSR